MAYTPTPQTPTSGMKQGIHDGLSVCRMQWWRSIKGPINKGEGELLEARLVRGRFVIELCLSSNFGLV